MNAMTLNAVWEKLEALDISPTETLVLLALAASTNCSSGSCHPPQGKLVTKTHLALSTIKETLAGLKARGIVDWRVKPAHVNEYRIMLDATGLPAATGGGAEERVGNGNPAPEPEVGAQEPVREAATCGGAEERVGNGNPAPEPEAGAQETVREAATGGAEERVGNGKRELPAPEASDEVKDLRLRLARFERVWKRATYLLGQMFARLIPDPGKRLTSMIDYQILIGKRAFLSCDSLYFRLKREIKNGKHDGEDIAELILSQLGKLPPTDDPSEPEPLPSESFQTTQSGKPDFISQA